MVEYRARQLDSIGARLAAASLASYLLFAASSAAATGAIDGVVTFEPVRQSPPGASYRVRTVDPIQDPDPPRAVVYLVVDSDSPSPEAATEVIEVTQRGYQFRPGIVAVPVGAQVSFPNEDNEFHSVFSYSPEKRFDLGRYRSDEQSPLVMFDKPGVIRVYCEIHKHMRGLLLVVDSPWFTATDTDGRFAFDAVPAGDYQIRALLPSDRFVEGNVAVREGETAHVVLGDER
jgi:plastocyanin